MDSDPQERTFTMSGPRKTYSNNKGKLKPETGTNYYTLGIKRKRKRVQRTT